MPDKETHTINLPKKPNLAHTSSNTQKTAEDSDTNHQSVHRESIKIKSATKPAEDFWTE